MATAGLLLDKGELHPNPVSDFKTILHLDLKTPNVFVGTNTTARFRGYPMPKVGDFGLCWTPANGPHGKECQKECGTPYNRAPEQYLVGEIDMLTMDSKTDVWGVGNIMWSLIEQETGDHRAKWDDNFKSPNDHDPDTSEKPRFREISKKRYSTILRGLIQSCMFYNPAQRPDFERVLRTIRQAYDHKPSIRSLRDRNEDDAEFAEGSENSMIPFLKAGTQWKWAREGASMQAISRKPIAAGGESLLPRVPPLRRDQNNGDQDQSSGLRPGPGLKPSPPDTAPKPPPSTTVPQTEEPTTAITGDKPAETNPADTAPRPPPADQPRRGGFENNITRPDIMVRPPPTTRTPPGATPMNPQPSSKTGLGTQKATGTDGGTAGPPTAPAPRKPRLQLKGPRPPAGTRKAASADGGVEDTGKIAAPGQTTDRNSCGCKCKDKEACLHRCCKRHLDDSINKRKTSQQMVADVKKAGGKKGGKAVEESGNKTAVQDTGAGRTQTRAQANDPDGGDADAAAEMEDPEVPNDAIPQAEATARRPKRKSPSGRAGPAKEKKKRSRLE